MHARIARAIRQNLVAWLALFVALGGTSIAATHYLITSTSQIKPSVLRKLRSSGVITSSKQIAPGVLKLLQGQAGAAGAPGAKGEPGPKGETGAPATTLWAVVASNGALARGGTGVVSSAVAEEPGEYEVVFDRNVSDCAYLANSGSTSDTSTYGDFASVATRSGNPDAVFVALYETDGKAAVVPFHLAVLC